MVQFYDHVELEQVFLSNSVHDLKINEEGLKH